MFVTDPFLSAAAAKIDMRLDPSTFALASTYSAAMALERPTDDPKTLYFNS